MANRITGLNSGLDTESLVSSLVSSYQKKVDSLTGNQKRLEWKQESWKSLNSSFTKFYNGSLDALTMKSAFLKKKTTATNASAVSISTKENAMITTQRMKVDSIASSSFSTGGKIVKPEGVEDKVVKGNTKLSELGVASNRTYKEKVLLYDTVNEVDENNEVIYNEDGTPKTKQVPRIDQETGEQAFEEIEKTGFSITLNVGAFKKNDDGSLSNTQEDKQSITLNFDDNATIDSVISAIKNAKIDGSDAKFNANFDEAQGRIYMASVSTGENYNFTFDNNPLVEALGIGSTSKYNAGTDAQITLNGVQYKDADGSFDINGLTIVANEVTKEEFIISTQTDTSGIYDLVKGLLKDYNEMIKTLDKAYYADSSVKYKMLTEDEKYAMSEKEVEEWEKKIKDGLLSKDSTLHDVTSKLKEQMLKGISITLSDGSTKTLSLSDFGINTGSYLTTAKDERGVLHLDGDKDDIISKNNEDKLNNWVLSDPDAVASFFSSLAKNMRSTMFNLMKGTEYSSSFTIYEDKLMASQYSDYNTKISAATQRLNKKQDNYYSKFARMETLMAKLNATQSNLSGYFG